MRTQLERSARMPVWIAGVTICLLAPLGVVTIVRSIPASYASIPDKGALPRHGAALSGSDDAHSRAPQSRLEAARAINSRNQVRCRECGIIESTRQIVRSGNVGGGKAVEVKVARSVSGRVSGGTIAANALTVTGFETTVRFRDGSKTVFDEATPRNWRSGSRVLVIAGFNDPKD